MSFLEGMRSSTPEENAAYERMLDRMSTKMVPVTELERLEVENDRLSDLVRDMYRSIVALCGWRYANETYLDRMHELGVEMSDGDA